MSSGYKLYRFCYSITRPIVGIFYYLRVVGRENIPKGACIICSSHSSNIDPFLIAYAFGLKHQLHILAKVQLFRIPILSTILKKIGMISVDRDAMDIASVKETLAYLKNDEKVLIFPEGRRITTDDAITAKTGAVKLAERSKVPLLPISIPRKKSLFRKVTIVIGKPYYIDKTENKRSQNDYSELSDILMEKILLLENNVSHKIMS
jgi:1-acyl-sn-glycerol-3-phosphate acyltransferase